MKLVILESPYAGDVKRNVRFAQLCMLDALQKNEAPYASHLLYPQVLNDKDPDERRLGMRAGFAWHKAADKVVVYTNLGITSGMLNGINQALARGIAVEYRRLEHADF